MWGGGGEPAYGPPMVSLLFSLIETHHCDLTYFEQYYCATNNQEHNNLS